MKFKGDFMTVLPAPDEYKFIPKCANNMLYVSGQIINIDQIEVIYLEGLIEITPEVKKYSVIIKFLSKASIRHVFDKVEEAENFINQCFIAINMSMNVKKIREQVCTH